jgi:hypothetical protein
VARVSDVFGEVASQTLRYRAFGRMSLEVGGSVRMKSLCDSRKANSFVIGQSEKIFGSSFVFEEDCNWTSPRSSTSYIGRRIHRENKTGNEGLLSSEAHRPFCRPVEENRVSGHGLS